MSDAVAGRGQYCPIARALDVLGKRWSLLIVRDQIAPVAPVLAGVVPT